MKKIVTTFLILVLCLALCACGGNDIYDSMDSTEQSTDEKYDEQFVGADSDYFAQLYGTWTTHSGLWHAGIITFYKDLTCSYDGEILQWYAWLSNDADRTPFYVIYRDGKAVYEGGITVSNDGTTCITLCDVVSEEEKEWGVPLSFRRKVTEEDKLRYGREHELLGTVYGQWKSSGALPEAITINKDYTGTYGEKPMVWRAVADSPHEVLTLVVTIDSVDTHTLVFGIEGAQMVLYPNWVPKAEDVLNKKSYPTFDPEFAYRDITR